MLFADGETLDVDYNLLHRIVWTHRKRVAPRHRALRARASGWFAPPLLLGPLPASDDGLGLKAAPEAE